MSSLIALALLTSGCFSSWDTHSTSVEDSSSDQVVDSTDPAADDVLSVDTIAESTIEGPEDPPDVPDVGHMEPWAIRVGSAEHPVLIDRVFYTARGTLLAAGRRWLADYHSPLLFIELDEFGNVLGQREVDGHYVRGPASVIEAREGGYFLAQNVIYGSAYSDVWIAHMNTDSELTWQKLIGIHATDFSHPAIFQREDGSLVLTAKTSLGPAGTSNIGVVTMTPDGSILASVAFWNGILSYSDGLFAELPTGHVILTARSLQPEHWWGDVIVAIDESGEIAWQTLVKGEVEDILVDDDGFTVAGMHIDSASPSALLVARLDFDGNLLWSQERRSGRSGGNALSLMRLGGSSYGVVGFQMVEDEALDLHHIGWVGDISLDGDLISEAYFGLESGEDRIEGSDIMLVDDRIVMTARHFDRSYPHDPPIGWWGLIISMDRGDLFDASCGLFTDGESSATASETLDDSSDFSPFPVTMEEQESVARLVDIDLPIERVCPE